MTRSIDLNSDLGEGCGGDEAMLRIVTSANIACGGHAGDAETMRKTISLAMEHGVSVGAHPSYPDKAGFGRRHMKCSPVEIRDFVRRQIVELVEHAHSLGAHVTYVKPHGALGNDAAAHRAIADAVVDGIQAADPRLAVLAISATHLEQAARDRGSLVFPEIYADRGYTDDGLLVPRSQPGAIIEGVEEAVARLRSYVETGMLTTVGHVRISLAGASICVHGDSEHAVEMAGAIREMLRRDGVLVEPFLR